MNLYEIYIRDLICKFVTFSVRLSMYFSNFRVFTGYWSYKSSTRTSTFRSKLHFLMYLTELTFYILSILVSKLEFQTWFPREISTTTEYWIKLMLIFSLTLTNPFIDVEYCLARLCNGRRVECKLNCFSINYLYDVIELQVVAPDWILSFRIKSVGLEVTFWPHEVTENRVVLNILEGH